jgi:hypothetical protein
MATLQFSQPYSFPNPQSTSFLSSPSHQAQAKHRHQQKRPLQAQAKNHYTISHLPFQSSNFFPSSTTRSPANPSPSQEKENDQAPVKAKGKKHKENGLDQRQAESHSRHRGTRCLAGGDCAVCVCAQSEGAALGVERSEGLGEDAAFECALTDCGKRRESTEEGHVGV